MENSEPKKGRLGPKKWRAGLKKMKVIAITAQISMSRHIPLVFRSWVPHPVDPRDPSGGPGTIPITPETFPMAET